jgi:hypothetical protein
MTFSVQASCSISFHFFSTSFLRSFAASWFFFVRSILCRCG